MSEHSARVPRGRVKRRLRGTLLVVLVGLVGVAVAAVASGRYQVRPVLSGSMRPGLPVGGVVITQRVPVSEIKARDVIVFTRPNDASQLVVHRVIKLTRKRGTVTIKTQGDANNTPDPWTLVLHGSSAYRAIYSVPLIGYPAVWFQDLGGRGLLVLAAGIAMLVAMVAVWRKDRRKVADAKPESVSADPDAVVNPEPEHDGQLDVASVIAAHR